MLNSLEPDKEGEDENERGKDEAEADEPAPTTHTATKEKEQKGLEGDEKKMESMNIESNQEREEVNHIPAPTEPAIAPKSTTPIPKQDHEINELIDDLTESNDKDEEVQSIC
ncbi:hypothetical protein PVK06_007829 [Gossypium arboreum]|uniref:Uncharacterized protein n=1 Tax=Gossypium arboreum TaxID=29729 RepID=A0ABR0QID5_GOSAR|nr:hypothetical protein PVK06_007829 [Gossypium arboreum]